MNFMPLVVSLHFCIIKTEDMSNSQGDSANGKLCDSQEALPSGGGDALKPSKCV